MTSFASKLCIICSYSTTHRCSRCKSACYRSKVCQKKDWPTHKLLCATFALFDTSSRPNNEHFKAILFPEDEQEPRLVWLHCYLDPVYGYHHDFLDPFLGANASPERLFVQHNLALKRDLTSTIQVVCRDNFYYDGSRENRSVERILATKPGYYYDWRGPIVVYGMIGLDRDPKFCRDLDLNDFRHFVDYLFWPEEPSRTIPRSPVIKILGVKINCNGEQRVRNKPQFEAIEVVSTHSIFSKHDTSDIAQRIGLPIFTQRCGPDQQWIKDGDPEILSAANVLGNQAATFLHLCCDPNAEFDIPAGTIGWGYASRKWQNRVGSIVVVRQDKKPLLSFHLEALCKYCQFEIAPLFAHSHGEYGDVDRLTEAAVLGMICKATFDIKVYKLYEEKCKEGADVRKIYPVSPYNV